VSAVDWGCRLLLAVVFALAAGSKAWSRESFKDFTRTLGSFGVPKALEGAPLAAAVGSPLPAPRYVDVAGVRFTRRVSCCLLYRLPPEPLCTSCPRRPAAEREVLLEDTAARMR